MSPETHKTIQWFSVEESFASRQAAHKFSQGSNLQRKFSLLHIASQFSKMGEATETESFEETILDLVRRVEELLLRQASNPRQRLLVALAGVPGSGKSTVSNALIFALGRRNVEDVAVVPMVSQISI